MFILFWLVLLLSSQKHQGYNVKPIGVFTDINQTNLMQIAESPKLPLDDEHQTGSSRADLPPPAACRALQLSHMCNRVWEEPGLPIPGVHCFSNHQEDPGAS